MFQTIKTGAVSAILITATLIAQGQKKIHEGIITYNVEYSPLSADQQEIADMLPKEIKITFNDNITKTEMDKDVAHIQIITDQNTKNSTVLIDIPVAQKQIARKTTKADYDKQKEGIPKFSDFKATGEKQIMAGYNATKYVYKDDKGANYEAWATTDIEIPRYEDDLFKDIKGALLKYTAFLEKNVKMTLTIKSITETKIGSLSLEVPDGYELEK